LSAVGEQTSLPWRREDDEKFLLFVRLTPKGGADRIEGQQILSDGSVVLKVRVRAVPEDGKANRALLELLSKALAVPLSALSLKSGATARIKTIAIGAAVEGMEARLRALV